MKKVLPILLACLVIIMQVMPVSAAQTTEYLPTLTIQNKDMPQVKAGQTVTIPISILNNSNYLAKNIEIKPILDEKSPFMVDELIVKKEKDQLSPRKVQNFDFKFKVDKNTKQGVYPIQLKINYKSSQKKPFEQTETVYVKVTSEHLPVELIVNNVTYNHPPQSGEEFEMSVDIKNTGSIAAENVFLTLHSNENFLVTGNVTERTIPLLSGQMTEKVSYKLTPKTDLEEGLYPVKATLKYINNYNESKTKEVELFVQVGGNGGGTSKLTITDVKAPKSASAKQEFSVSFNIKNDGTATAKDIQVTATPEEDAIVPLSLNKQVVGSLEAGKAKGLTYKFMAKDDAKTKNYPIKLTITYKKNGKEVSVDQYVGVNVIGNSGGSGTVPLMIVSGYSTDPQIVNAGQQFALDLTLWNTNAEKSVKNMKVTLSIKNTSKDTNDDVFTPVDGSNTLYVPGLAPNQKTSKKLKFYTIPDAKARNYKIDVAFEYEYNQNGEVTKGTSTDQIGIQVVQPAEVQVVNFNTDDAPTTVGKKGYITISTNNIGNVGVKNLQAKLTGDLGEETIFFGNLETGKSNDFKFRVRPTEEGTKNGSVEVSYKDTRGEIITEKKDFTIEVGPAEPSMDELGMMSPDGTQLPGEETKSKKPLFIAIGIGGFAVLVIIIIILKKRKKKKEMMYDEAL